MLSRRHFFTKISATTAGFAILPGSPARKQSPSSINVLDAGAKGDGLTDDIEPIQEAINYICKRGGGKIIFPYTSSGYRIAKPPAWKPSLALWISDRG